MALPKSIPTELIDSLLSDYQNPETCLQPACETTDQSVGGA
ncbi:hypothetical protein [Methylomonas albis]|nr:hypothetical protein [Methylomonas albis]